MSIGDIFSDAQRSAVSHRALAKRLRRLETTTPDFTEQVQQCIYRLLEVAKSENAGNRVVKFLTVYVESIQPAPASEEGDESTPATSKATEEENNNGSAIVSALLLGLMPCLCAKDKTMRYRATQIVSQILGVLTAIDDDMYRVVRHELLKRLRDKVPAIRLEAVLALGRIVENEMDEEDEQRRTQSEDEDDSEFEDPDQRDSSSSGLLEKLLDVLQNDSNAEVRRALLLNLPITPKTLPYLLERARDRDGPTRRALYAKLLPNLGDFRHLSLSMREKLLRWGLRDRDEKVRNAAARIFRERWIEDCAASRIEKSSDEEGVTKKRELHDPSIPALLELLERIDVVNNGNETGIALEAMKEFWAGRPDYMDAVTFDDDFWTQLTPESAFMARTFNAYCQSDPKYQSMVEEKMPEVTRLGFYIQKYINSLMEQTQNAGENGTANEEETAEQEFVLEQLLHIAHTLDYTDEIGRRKMFSLLREALAMADLPEESTKLTVEALRLVCNSDAAGEREFTAVVLEAIAEVHDTIMSSDAELDPEDDSFVSAKSDVSNGSHSSQGQITPTSQSQNQTRPSKKSNKHLTEEEQEQKAVREIMVNMKCLHIAQCMLQNVVGNLSTNIHLETMLHNLVIPAVRSHEAPIRERGIVCLGLCCLLEPHLAQENTKLFVHCLSRGNETLRVLSIQILCDILLVSPRALPSATESPSEESALQKQEKDRQTLEIVEKLTPFVRGVGYTNQPLVQDACTSSLAKLILCGWYPSSTGASEDAFDEAVLRAEEMKAKGWDVLKKCRDAVKSTDAGTEGGKKDVLGSVGGGGGNRRSSGATVVG